MLGEALSGKLGEEASTSLEADTDWLLCTITELLVLTSKTDDVMNEEVGSKDDSAKNRNV